LHTYWGNEDSVTPDCIPEREKQMEYLGNMKAMVYMGEQIFNQNGYNEDTILKRSRFYTQ